MNREEAAAVLDAIIFGVYPDDDIIINKIGIEAVRFAITALREPQWVKTSERLPTLKDAPNGRVVNAWSYAPMSGEYGIMVGNLEDVEATANPKDYWMPLPPLPEVEA